MNVILRPWQLLLLFLPGGINRQQPEIIENLRTENQVLRQSHGPGMPNLGHKVSHTTVGKILRAHGIEPVPERRRQSTWQVFLKSHWDVLGAIDTVLAVQRVRMRCG